MKNVFVFDKVKPFAMENFKKKAQFSLKDLPKKERKRWIQLEDLVKLLMHYRIIVELPKPKNTLFMPHILKNANPSKLEDMICEEIDTLIINYKSGYVPLGMFSFLMVRLASCWELNEDDLYRNRIQFIVEDQYKVVLIGIPTCLKVMVDNTVVCRKVYQIIERKLKEEADRLQYGVNCDFDFAFNCCCAEQKSHLMIKKTKMLQCTISKSLYQLNDSQKVWFKVCYKSFY